METLSRNGEFRRQLRWLESGHRGSLLDIGLCRCVRWGLLVFSSGAVSILLFHFWNSRGCSRAHLHFLNRWGCRLGCQCQPSASVCRSRYSRIWCICRRFHLRCTLFRAGEETMQWPWLLRHARWISLVAYYDWFCSRSSTCCRFHQKLATAHRDSISVHILLACDPPISRNSHSSASYLCAGWSYLVSRCSRMNCSKLHIRFFLHAPWTFWLSFVFARPNFTEFHLRCLLPGGFLSWTRTRWWWCPMGPNRKVWLPLKLKRSINKHKSQGLQPTRFRWTSLPG